MRTAEILQGLLDLSKEEREYIIYTLMVDNKISYTEISKWYVASLERQKDRDVNIKAELASCLLMETMYQRAPRKGKSVKDDLSKLIHRTIAILDVVNCFNLESWKKRYNYQEEVGKAQGTFWKIWEKI